MYLYRCLLLGLSSVLRKYLFIQTAQYQYIWTVQTSDIYSFKENELVKPNTRVIVQYNVKTFLSLIKKTKKVNNVCTFFEYYR